MPLTKILEQVRAELPGEVLEVELEDEDEEEGGAHGGRGRHGRLVYEFKVLTPDGRLVELYYDAATGRRVAEHDGEDDARPRR